MKKLLMLFIAILCLSGCGKVQRDEVIIALLDTGVSTTAIQSENLLPGWNYVTDSDDTEDRINHGTAVSSVILGCESAEIVGTAPDTRVVPLVITDKVDGEVKSVTPGKMAKAIRDSVDKFDACIINVSLGIGTDDPELRDAVKYVQKKGALVIAAAGNNGESNELYYPAAYDGVLTVGSHDKNLKISDFTQQNGTVDILAPGEDIWLASRNGKIYGARGTSYAAGYVSAAAALVWEMYPEIDEEDVSNSIFSSAQMIDGWQILDVGMSIR